MDDDFEDGELSGSSSEPEMGAAAAAPAVLQASEASSGQSFQSRAAERPSAPAYRNFGAAAADSSDSDADSSDEEQGVLWRRKRQKVSNVLPSPGLPGPTTGGRKVNNVWGSVVQEQCQEALTAELGIFGMEGDISMANRSVETYNYILARKIIAKEKEEERQVKADEQVSMLDAQLEDYMKGQGSEERAGGDAKRKRHVKERLGPRAEMDIKGRFEITEDDPEDKVADEIAHRLREPKKDLIERVVQVIGTEKAIELLRETAALEESGGMPTVDGSRRRTPGGVYLNLLKNASSVTKAQIRQIFFNEHQKDYKSKKAAHKRRRNVVAKKMKQAIGMLNLQEHDDVSRETFASDTNEALESLKEAAEEEEEEEAAAAVGTEETPVVYNSADLEVF